MPFWRRKQPVASPEEMYARLRGMALEVSREEAGIPPPSPEAPVWGVVMDLGVESGTATLVALGQDTASMYFSSGGGVIGGGTHESVRRAAAAFIAAANPVVSQAEPAGDTAVPLAGQVRFLLRTDAGIRATSRSEQELGAGRDPLSPLFFAGHGLIRELRLLTPGGAQPGET